jgi:hypothetical protein
MSETAQACEASCRGTTEGVERPASSVERRARSRNQFELGRIEKAGIDKHVGRAADS